MRTSAKYFFESMIWAKARVTILANFVQKKGQLGPR